jgi:hypothetical protein
VIPAPSAVIPEVKGKKIFDPQSNVSFYYNVRTSEDFQEIHPFDENQV